MRWLFLILIFPLFGVYVGNPADPAIMNSGIFSTTYPFFKFTSGYIYDYTFDKKYVSDDTDQIKKFGLHSQVASMSLIFIERLQLFGTAGGSKEKVKEKNESIYDYIVDFKSNYHFSWSAGAKVILLQWGSTFFSSDFTYFAIPESKKSFFKFFDKLNLPIEPAEKQKLSLKEWQLSCALSSRIFFLTPYIGGSYLRSKLHIDEGDVPAINFKNQVNWGYFYGLTLSLSGKLHVNFEKRLRDEFGYTLSTIAVF